MCIRDSNYIVIFRYYLSEKQHRVSYFYTVSAVGSQKQLRIIKVVEIIYRSAGSEFYAFYLMKIDIVYLLSLIHI